MRASDRLPRAAFEGALQRRFRHGVSRAAATYAGAIVVYVICVVFVEIPQAKNATFAETLYLLFGTHFLIATPAVLSCLNIATRWRDHERDDDALRLTDLAITICVVVAAVLVVGDVIGFFAVFGLPGTSGSTVLYAILLQAAAAVASAAGVVWGLAELSVLRTAGPAGAVPPAR